jgi:hypothetical protein
MATFWLAPAGVGAQAHGGEERFDGTGSAQVLPVPLAQLRMGRLAAARLAGTHHLTPVAQRRGGLGNQKATPPSAH